jgi:outer membrane protein assembly factor BamB
MRRSAITLSPIGLLALFVVGLVVQLAIGRAAPPATAGDWPQFRFDAARSGYTPPDLASDLALRWKYESEQPPQPAWVGPDTRLPFDHAYQPVVASGLLYFGSSADCKVYALDAATGEERWSAYTDSPVRFAPAVWEDRLFIASDDGNLYCFEAATGRRLWVKRIGPGPDMVLGNGRLISRWPVRGGPAISGNVLYVAAGIWPSEGIYLKALDAETGEPLWTNDTAGYIEMDQPHGGARAKSGVSAQGYLTVAPDTLLVPTGRATPAAFDLADGDFRYFHLQEYSRRGAGPFITAVGDWHFSEFDGFFTEDGERFARGIPSAGMAALPDYIVFAEKSEIKAISRSELLVEKEGADRRGEPIKTLALNDPAWTIACPGPVGPSLIGAGSKIIAGITGEPTRSTPHQVVVADTDSRAVVFTAELDGPALGLAVADGRLYVSTDQGTIYCFAQGAGPAATVGPAPNAAPPADGSLGSLADEIIAKTGITKGYCVDLGCGDGSLAYELA